MNVKIYIILAASSFGLMILGSIIFNVLVPQEFTNNPQVEKIGLIVYFVLFLVLGFAVVPIFLKIFYTLQAKIGNQDLPLVKWIREHDQGITYFMWGFFLLGLIIALPAIIKDWFSK
ncbi:MAG: hypothetical protein A2W19_03320 [Spirochaetes bacterium RBG_16_49_21]|nr:MAG: hypothetical protein A2W19_03320 [Spirochaetes bacterium RBG_16_49_21]